MLQDHYDLVGINVDIENAIMNPSCEYTFVWVLMHKNLDSNIDVVKNCLKKFMMLNTWCARIATTPIILLN